MKKKNIAVITSTRADYNYFRLILKKIKKSNVLSLSLIVTGMHLLKKARFFIYVQIHLINHQHMLLS